MNTTQPEFTFLPGVTADDVETLRDFLAPRGWQTRRQITFALDWSERKIRRVAESMGSDIVRGQCGFKLVDVLEREDFSDAIQAADAAISQGKGLIRYGFALKNKLHKKLA